jgi:hypothetical protein
MCIARQTVSEWYNRNSLFELHYLIEGELHVHGTRGFQATVQILRIVGARTSLARSHSMNGRELMSNKMPERTIGEMLTIVE